MRTLDLPKQNFLKKIISAVLLISFAISVIPVNAAVLNYTAGPRIYTVKLDDAYASSGTAIYKNSKTGEPSLKLNANGKVTYRFYLPFDAATVTIHFDDTKMERSYAAKYKCTINDKGYETSTEIGRVRQRFGAAYPFLGDNTLTIEARNEIYIEKIEYTKVTKYVSETSGLYTYDYEKRPVTEFSDYEYAIHTAMIAHESSPIFKINGARRYLDYDNRSLKPLKKNGTIYLPLKSLGLALGFYTEELPEKKYALLRNDAMEYIVKDGTTYESIGGGEYKKIKDLFVFEGGRAWAPLRYFAERLGKTVVYKEGFVFVDYYELANALANEKLQEVKKDFAGVLGGKVSGKTYYVAKSANASDNNNGSKDRPFATLNKAGAVAQPGDTVIIREGTYYETFTPKNNGNAANPITYKAADGEKVTISALEHIGTPISNENGLWVFEPGWTMGEGRNMVFNNGKVVVEGRHPNSHTSGRVWDEKNLGYSDLWPTMGAIDVLKDDMIDMNNDGKDDNGDDVELTAGSTTDLNQDSGYWVGGTLVSFHGRGWNLGMAKIEDSESGVLYLNNPTTTWWFDNAAPAESASNMDYAYITNHINTVDMPGEWYWSEDGKLYMYPLEDVEFDFSKLEGKARQLTVDMRNSKYINLVNINTLGGSMNLLESEMCVVNGGTHEYISHYTYSDDQHYGFLEGYDVFDKNGAPLRGELGLTIGGRDNAVVNAEIRYSAGAGLYVSGLFGYFDNNLIEETGYMSSYVGGIYLTALAAIQEFSEMRGGHGIYNNTVTKTGRGGLILGSIEAPWFQTHGMTPFIGSDVAYNKIINACLVSRDTGVVYMHGTISGDDRLKMKIHHNIVGDVWNYDGQATAIYFDNYIQNIDCYSNITCSERPVYRDIIVQGSIGELNAPAGGFADSFATIECWNNSELGQIEGGIDSINVEDYPMHQYFLTGCGTANTETCNYTDFNGESDGLAAVDGKIKGGIIRDDAVYFNEDNGYVCFENVDFEDYNSIGLLWKGNYIVDEIVKVYVGDTFETAKCTEAIMNTYTPYPNAVTFEPMFVKGCTDKTNVYVSGKKGGTLGIVGIKKVNVDQKQLDQQPDVKKNFVEYTELTVAGSILQKRNNTIGQDVLYNTFGNPVIKFEDFEIEAQANTVMICGGTAGVSAGQKIEIRIDDPASEPAATISADMDSWSSYSIVSAKLNTVLKPGKYDIYVKCVSGTNKSTDLWWLGFGDVREATDSNKEAE